MSNSISLCMIAKDEEHTIDRCIQSVKPFVDQIVVVDTGSADNTPQLAKELGAETYHLDWQDDFSHARNYSLQFATGDWILFLDCDEELEAKTGSELRKVVANPAFDGYWLNFINIYQNQPSSNFLSFRLFRNNPNFRFECPIHEQILPSVISNSTADRIGQANVTVYHYGYEDSEVMAKNKTSRNIRLLEKARQEYGDAGFVNFYLGVEHQRIGNYKKALDYYAVSLKKSSLDESFTPAMIRSMVHCYISLNRYQDGLKLLNNYLDVYPDYTDLVYLKGVLYYYLEDYQGTLLCMNKCINIGPPPSRYFSLQGIADTKPKELIYQTTNSIINKCKSLVNQGDHYQSFHLLNAAFNQLEKTPDKELFISLIGTMLSLKA